MSEEGWRGSLAADDVEGWVVLHGGATAAFRVGSMAAAAGLAAGGRIVSRSQEHWTLSDRAGNRVCIAVWPNGDTTSEEAAE